MKDLFRNLLSIRQKRRPAPVGGVPAVGVSIIRGDVKMTVTDPISRDLWSWMVLSGWRNVPVKNDRRQYVELPDGLLKQLIDAAPTERDAVHARIMAKAKEE